MHLKTERTFVRPFFPSDEEAVFEIYSNPRTCQYLLEEPWTLENKRDAFQKKLKANHLFENQSLNLACVVDEKVIGDIFLWFTGMKDTVEIGFVFHEEVSGKGYATEAVFSVMEHLFDEYRIHRIQANLDARNVSSAKLCQRLGMRLEAHYLEDFWCKNQWTDSYVYGMLLRDLKERENSRGRVI